jgi:cardiolipin synthase
MFAEDLLQDLRREGFTPGSVTTYVRKIASRVARGLPDEAELVRSAAATAFVVFAIQFGAALLLSWAFGRKIGVPYLVASSVVLLAASFWILTHIGLLHGERAERPIRRIPLPVVLTLLRLVSVPAIVLLIQDHMWGVVVWIFAASASTDVIDGVLARALRQESQIGSVLDPAVDIAFNGSIFVALAIAGALPWWVTALMLVRYGLLVFGTCYLYLFHGPVRIQPTAFGKLTGLLTSVLVGLLLLGLASWSDAVRGRLKEVFDLGLGLLAFATIIQVVFIGISNLKSFEVRDPDAALLKPAAVLAGSGQAVASGSGSVVTSSQAKVVPGEPVAGKIVGDVRWPRG